jgi:hypothetical protein
VLTQRAPAGPQAAGVGAPLYGRYRFVDGHAVKSDIAAIIALYDSTFSRTVWRLYGGAKGLVMWY